MLRRSAQTIGHRKRRTTTAAPRASAPTRTDGITEAAGTIPGGALAMVRLDGTRARSWPACELMTHGQLTVERRLPATGGGPLSWRERETGSFAGSPSS